jgi:hypothetical protein
VISEQGDSISKHGGAISDKVARIRSLVTLISELFGVISFPGASIRCMGDGVRGDGTAISVTVAQIRSLVRPIRERCRHVKCCRANFACTGGEKV